MNALQFLMEWFLPIMVMLVALLLFIVFVMHLYFTFIDFEKKR